MLARAATRWRRDGGARGAEQLAAQVARVLKAATSAFTLLVALIIMLHGVGITGLPRVTWARLAAWTTDPALPVLFIIGSAFVVLRTVYLVSDRLPELSRDTGTLSERLERRKRAASAGRLLRWGGTAVVVLVATLMALRQLGVDLTPILAGGAVVSVAVGFGAQNFVRDLIAGLFLIVENQVRVGDIASINGKSGQVEAIRLRVIVLRSLDGTVHIIPNGAINELSNMTKDFSYAVIDVGVAYREKVDHVMDVLATIGRELAEEPPYTLKILAPLEVLGVDEFADSAVVIKVRVKVVPLEQWVVGRELRRRIKNRFDELDIRIPFPHLTIDTSGTMAVVMPAAPIGVPVAPVDQQPQRA